MKRYWILLLLLSFLLTGCTQVPPASSTETTSAPTETKPVAHWIKDAGHTFYIKEDGSPHTGWLELDGKQYYLNNDGILQTGWLELDGKRHYLNNDGILQTGWLELDGKRYYLNNDGILHTGWLELDGKQYYLKDDGSITCGKAIIDRTTYYFTSAGVSTLVVNPWNVIPEGYTPDLVDAEDGYIIDSSCRDALLQMLADCRTAGYDARITSAYRRHQVQVDLYNKKVWYYIDRGYAVADARKKAATIVAIPGTSEHQLGLAVDLVDSSHWTLDESQENTPAQKWLMEHCHEYGFILRYPVGSTEITGIIYEPWHYRYVGVEIAQEITNLGITLEEYLGAA